ncbi:MAG: hypothetical protein AAFN78_07200 [Pseudomonadota bacterium]
MMSTWLLEPGLPGGHESHDAPSYFTYYEDKLKKRGVRVTNTNSLHREFGIHAAAGPAQGSLSAEAPESDFDTGGLELSDAANCDMELLSAIHS